MKDRGDKLPGLASIVEMDDDIENLLVSTDPDTSGAMPQPVPRDKVLDISTTSGPSPTRRGASATKVAGLCAIILSSTDQLLHGRE